MKGFKYLKKKNTKEIQKSCDAFRMLEIQQRLKRIPNFSSDSSESMYK